jgi:hypothetical protein
MSLKTSVLCKHSVLHQESVVPPYAIKDNQGSLSSLCTGKEQGRFDNPNALPP